MAKAAAHGDDYDDSGDVGETAVMVTGNGIAALLSVSASNVLKVSRMLEKSMDLARVKEDPETIMRIFTLVTDYNISLIDAVSKTMLASKSKDGKIAGISEQVLGALDATMGSAVGDPKAKNNSRITRLVG